jgi:hypothetical protein
MQMAKHIYLDLKRFKDPANGGTYGDFTEADNDKDIDPTDTIWTGIEGRIQDFINLNLTTISGDTIPNPVTVTQKGYLDKIRQLYPGYAPDFSKNGVASI